MKRILFGVMVFGMLSACEKPVEEIYSDLKQVEEDIIAIAGGTLITSDSLKLYIPPEALPLDGIVFLGKTGNEPSAVPNNNIQIEGEPFTLRFPSAFIQKPLHVEIPVFSSLFDSSSYFALLYNGNTYYPIPFTVDDSKIKITIDQIDWEATGEKNTHITSTLVILFARYKQSIPENEMGLQKIRYNNETKDISYESPSAGVSSRVLLLIHGWTASPEKWNTFLPWLFSNSELPYTEYWTFGYNSSRSINFNGELLAELMESHSNGARIDIVAHSMGGLVSRSMIENFNGSQYVDKLITLGSPHEGSPLAVFRFAIGALVAEDNPDATMAYNYNTQGFRDLDTSSVFIRKMKELKQPPVPYYTIAATNDPGRSLFSEISSDQLLEGPDDGIVAVSSAHGVSGAVSSDTDINIPEPWAHTKMPEDTNVFNQVVNLLYQ